MALGWLTTHPANAASETGLAFVLGTGSHLAIGKDRVSLPEGARIELLVGGERIEGRHPVTMNQAGLVLPEIDLGPELGRLRVRLSDPGSGWLTPGADGIALELTTTVAAELVGAADAAGDYTLALTTGTAVQEAAPTTDAVEATGAAIDPVTRAARLVATATIGADSPVGAGEALVVVLEGRFEGLPASLR